jgi:hypothetical protein
VVRRQWLNGVGAGAVRYLVDHVLHCDDHGALVPLSTRGAAKL